MLGFAIVIANLQLIFWERFSLDIIHLLLSRRDKIWLWWAMPTLQFSLNCSLFIVHCSLGIAINIFSPLSFPPVGGTKGGSRGDRGIQPQSEILNLSLFPTFLPFRCIPSLFHFRLRLISTASERLQASLVFLLNPTIGSLLD